MAVCRVLCVSRALFSSDRLWMCLLCCGSVSCVVCEPCGVQLRPAVDVLVVPYGVRLAMDAWQNACCVCK